MKTGKDPIKVIAEGMDYDPHDEMGGPPPPPDDFGGDGGLDGELGGEEEATPMIAFDRDGLYELLVKAKTGDSECDEGGSIDDIDAEGGDDGLPFEGKNKKKKTIKENFDDLEDEGGEDEAGGVADEVDGIEQVASGDIDDVDGEMVDEEVMALVDKVFENCAEAGICSVDDVKHLDDAEGDIEGMGDSVDDLSGGIDDGGGDDLGGDDAPAFGDDEMAEAVMQSVDELIESKEDEEQADESEEIALESTDPVYSIEIPNKYKTQYEAYLAEDGGYVVNRDGNPYIYINEEGARQIGGKKATLTSASPALDYFMHSWSGEAPDSLTESIKKVRSLCRFENYEGKPDVIAEEEETESLAESVSRFLDIDPKLLGKSNSNDALEFTGKQAAFKDLAEKMDSELKSITEGYDTKKIGSMSKYRRCFPVEGGGRLFFVFK